MNLEALQLAFYRLRKGCSVQNMEGDWLSSSL